jgi:hypothetical protein
MCGVGVGLRNTSSANAALLDGSPHPAMPSGARGAVARTALAKIRTEARRTQSSRAAANAEEGSSGAQPPSLCRNRVHTALSKQPSASVEQVVQELMNRNVPKPERMRLLRELVRSGEEVPDELLEKALRRLMERLTD